MYYNALLVSEQDGKFNQTITKLNLSNLPQNDVLIKVHYSSLNYKDALSAIGNRGVTKTYPHTPGIDATGVVIESSSSLYTQGDKVIVTGYDLGMNTPGGFGEYIRVPAEWVVPLPENLTMKEAMIIGTAGFTAGISLVNLTEKVKPDAGKIIVTGATGGVGSVALALLSNLGYETVAVSGKRAEHDFLRSLGAESIIDREEFKALDKKPILSAQYAGGVDTVGGEYIENIVKSVKPLGIVTTCGSVAGTELNMSVFPFILRGISLVGVSSQNYPTKPRHELWQKLANEWKPNNLLDIYNEIELKDLPNAIKAILKGELKGRTVIKLID